MVISDEDVIRINSEELNSNNSEFCDTLPIYLTKFRNRKRNCRKSLNPKHRLVLKNGNQLVYRIKRQFLSVIYIHDLVNTLIISDWKWTLLALTLTYIFIWFLFAYVWMMVSLNNGDLDTGNTTNPCLNGIQTFAGYLLFSIETQTTIGYGTRYISHHCTEAILIFCIQIVTGVGICGILIGIVYGKITSPRKVSAKSCFSKYAVICQRDGQFCLIFRVKDEEKKFQCYNKVKAYVIQSREREPFLKDLKLKTVGFMIWPIEVVHEINSKSPFWDFSAKDLILKKFEIVVLMEGVSVLNSKMSVITTSYLNSEILWGHSFKPCTFYNNNSYIVNHKLFNSTKETMMPLCSPKRLSEVSEEISLLFSSSEIQNFDNMTNSPNSSTSRRREDQIDPLLLSLQKFLQDNYCETSL